MYLSLFPYLTLLPNAYNSEMYHQLGHIAVILGWIFNYGSRLHDNTYPNTIDLDSDFFVEL